LYQNFDYIDVKKIDEAIENSVFDMIREDNQLLFRKESHIGSLFKMYYIKSSPLLDLLHLQFGKDLKFRIQTQTTGYQPIHIDPSRTFAINYYLDLGGENCFTHFYPTVTSTIPLESVKIKSKSWCRLNVKTAHNVVGITGTRIAITVCDG